MTDAERAGANAVLDEDLAQLAKAGDDRPEPTYREWVAANIGPRLVGGRYRSGYGSYTVLAIDAGPRESWPTWQITVLHDGWDYPVSHCTPWDAHRDTILAEPAADQAPMIHWLFWGPGQPNKCGIPAQAASLSFSEVTCPACRTFIGPQEQTNRAPDAPLIRPRRRTAPRRRHIAA